MRIPIDQIDMGLVKSETIDEVQLQDIADSMAEQGQIHPIIVRPANGRFELVAGEKRVLAARKLNWDGIEAEVKSIPDDNEAKVMRVHENLKRFNLPWWEQVVLVEQLHTIRQEQHGKASVGRPLKSVDKAGWGVRDTAQELGVAIGPLSEDINLARAVQSDPSLRNIKDKKTALRLVRLAARRIESEAEAGAPSLSDIDENEVYCGDSATVLANLPANTFDAVITDPPWLRFYEAALTRDERTLPVFKQVYRVMKMNTLLYVFVGYDDFVYYCGHDTVDDHTGETIHVMGELEKIGFEVAKTPLIWQKTNSMSRRGVRAWEYDRDFELIIVAAKGSPLLTSATNMTSIKTFPIVPTRSMIHPNEKPVDLLIQLLDDCTFDGSFVLDPFAGSGALLEAAKKNNRRFIGIERDHRSYQKIRKRLGLKEE